MYIYKHTHLTICLLKPDNYRVGRYQFRRWYKFFEKSLVRKQIRKKVLSWWLNMVNILTNTTNVGWRQNFESVFGENRWLWLLPVVAGGPVRPFCCSFFSLRRGSARWHTHDTYTHPLTYAHTWDMHTHETYTLKQTRAGRRWGALAAAEFAGPRTPWTTV